MRTEALITQVIDAKRGQRERLNNYSPQKENITTFNRRQAKIAGITALIDRLTIDRTNLRRQ